MRWGCWRCVVAPKQGCRQASRHATGLRNHALTRLFRPRAGQLVSTSLYRQGAYTVSFDLTTFLISGQPIAIGQRETMGNPCMNNYTAGDGRRFWLVGLQFHYLCKM